MSKKLLDYRWRGETKRRQHTFPDEEAFDSWFGEFGDQITDWHLVDKPDPIIPPDSVPATFAEEYPNYDAWLYPEMFKRYKKSRS